MGKLLAIAALLAGTSMLVADTAVTLLDAAESGDHAAAMRLVSAKGTHDSDADDDQNPDDQSWFPKLAENRLVSSLRLSHLA